MEFILNRLNEYVLIIDRKGIIKFCNNKFLLKLGYSREEIHNSCISIVLKNQEENIKEILATRDENKINLTFNGKDKKDIKIDSEIILEVYEGCEVFYIIGKDTNTKLHTIKDLETLLDNIEIGASIKNPDGRYIYGNDLCVKLAGTDKESFIGSYDRDYLEEQYIDEYIKSNKVCSPKLFEELIEVDGVALWYETYRAPIYDKNNKLECIIAITKNINIDKKIQEELYKNYNQITNLKDEKDSVDKNLDIYEFLYYTGKALKNYIGADGISILLYDEIEKSLVPFIKIGESNKTLKNVDKVGISDEEVKSCINNSGNTGIKSREELINTKGEIGKYLFDTSYLGSYGIKLNNEFFGSLNVSYTNDNVPKYYKDDFIEVICNKIAMVIKNYSLSEELRIENEKRTSTEKELELYLNTAVDLIGTIGIDGYFKKINPSWTKVLGWSTDELLSKSINELIHPKDMHILRNMVCIGNIPEEIRRVVARILCKSGNYIYLDWSTKYIKEREIFILTVKDITEQKKIEEEKNKLEEVVKIESIKNEFFANVSHEFKTPLNIILGTMQLIKKNIDQNTISMDRLNKHTNMIRQNSYRLLRLVNNLIDISKIDIGYYELNLSNHNIVSIIEDITLSVAEYVEDRNINLIFDTDEEEIITACDPDKIERVVLNILSNAIKYTDEKGQIEVNLKYNYNDVIISIKDNGIGIPNEKLDMIFNRFGQVNSTLSRRVEGSGIGLSLVKSIVDLHGGQIKVNSELGKGTEFIIELPINVLDEEVKIALDYDSSEYRIEKCSIEFSDIYS